MRTSIHRSIIWSQHIFWGSQSTGAQQIKVYIDINEYYSEKLDDVTLELFEFKYSNFFGLSDRLTG